MRERERGIYVTKVFITNHAARNTCPGARSRFGGGLQVCDFAEEGGEDFWSWTIQSLHDLLLKTIVYLVTLQPHIMSAASSGSARRLNIEYCTAPHTFSVNSAVELLSRDLYYIHNHKSTLSAFGWNECFIRELFFPTSAFLSAYRYTSKTR